ncbi:MAG: sulfur carrier protein ThiS [Kiloniellales bacterium]|nr:sulfur carrier protein ThiS [Kiloniellales bacterium]
MSGTITVNGETRTLRAATVLELLRDERLETERAGLAVARNGAVVPRRAWPDTALADGDRIEIVKPFSGG